MFRKAFSVFGIIGVCVVALACGQRSSPENAQQVCFVRDQILLSQALELFRLDKIRGIDQRTRLADGPNDTVLYNFMPSIEKLQTMNSEEIAEAYQSQKMQGLQADLEGINHMINNYQCPPFDVKRTLEKMNSENIDLHL